MSNKSTIAKNSLFLYVRMFLLMGVTLYTSRVVLQQLGVSDYGVYILLGGVVSALGFFNAAMSTATQRYLAFDIGLGDHEKLRKTFSTTLLIHIFIASLIVLVAETAGVWYVNNKMIFPMDRIYAVNFVFQLSIATFVLNIIQIPYNALIIARERMSIYAYISVMEVVLKLLGAYFLVYQQGDKLIAYAAIIFIVSLVIRVFYQIYCRRNFVESKFYFVFDKQYIKELLGYSGWNLFGNIAGVARNQGNSIILNIFFGTVVNAAYGIAFQIQVAVQQFVSNFQAAINPQIIKQYAVGNTERMHNLIFMSSKISFFLLIIIVFPIWFHLDFLLSSWLGIVPQGTLDFVKLSFIYLLIDSISYPLITAVQATGKVKRYQVFLGSFIFLSLPLSYLALKFGMEAKSVFYILIFITFSSLIIRMFFLKNLLHLKPTVFTGKVLMPISFVVVALTVFSSVCDKFSFFEANSVYQHIIYGVLFFLVGVITVFCLGFTNTERNLFLGFIRSKFNGKN
ncbi:oligosaccharide flippase family protein [Sphingobacterium thalpophilum]|uniref:oligosaccharide flippase family protein n=1 Tax=Sphingobacterium thalpophilum TaxID=259 RepID=UPI003DA4418D